MAAQTVWVSLFFPLDSSDYTVTVNEGSTINLPCHRPPFAQAEAYALWFKDTAAGERTRLTPVEVPSPGQRLEWLYSDPTDNDQTITLKELAMVDAGIYHCESAEGEKFNAINLIVKGKLRNSLEHYSISQASSITFDWNHH